MKDSRRSGAGRLVAEGLVIVVSVLLALSADAWWSRLEDGARVADHLQALGRDFDQMAHRAAASYDFATAGWESGFSLVHASADGDMEVLRDSAYTWLGSVGSYEVFSPSLGAYESLIASGDIELLPSESLRRALAEFFGSFEDVRVTERALIDSQGAFFGSEPFAELVGEHRVFGYPEQFPTVGIAQPEQLRRWTQSDFILSGVTWLALQQSSTREDYLFLEAEIEKIRPMLQALDRAGADS